MSPKFDTQDYHADTSPKKLWIISEQYYPQETATGYLLTELAEGLSEHFSVNVICTMPGKALVSQDLPKNEIRNRVKIYRSNATSFNKDNLLLRLINVITGSLALFLQTLRLVSRPDDVLVVTNPPTLPFLISAASWLKRNRTILLIYDVYPEAAFAAGLLHHGSAWGKLLDQLNHRLYKKVDSIIVLGRDMRGLVARKLRGIKKDVTVIPNWADLEKIKPHPTQQNQFLKDLGLTDKFIIQYAGNMARVNDIESLVHAAIDLTDHEDIHFLFVGAGAKREWLEQTINTAQLKNITILPPLPRSEQDNFLNACHIGVIALNAGMRGVSVPSRSYNIMAAGKPILAIAEPGTEIDQVIAEHGIGWVVPPHQPQLLAKTILDIQSHPKLLTEKGQKARRIAEQHYSLKTTVEKYRQVINHKAVQ